MEVHHHPEVEKKGIKEYLLEGFMIFVAVTMGFFAESLRENINNKDKEKEYIVSLVNNLEKDTAALNYTIHVNQWKIRALDTIVALANKDMADVANRKKLYQYEEGISNTAVFISNDATMTQLKNSSGLQYIKHDHIADSISFYDMQVRDVYAAEAPYTKYITHATGAMTEILLFTLKKDEKTYPLITTNPQQLQVFFNKIKLEEGWTRNYVENVARRRPYVNRLIALLKQEYNLDRD